MRAGEFQDALRLSFESLRIARPLGNDKLVAGNLDNIGEVHSCMGAHRIARDYLLQALPIWEKAESPRELADCLLCLGNTYLQTGEGDEALRYYERARTLAHDAEHPRVEANAREAIATVYDAQGRLGDALRELRAVMPIREEIGDCRRCRLSPISMMRLSSSNNAMSMNTSAGPTILKAID